MPTVRFTDYRFAVKERLKRLIHLVRFLASLFDEHRICGRVFVIIAIVCLCTWWMRHVCIRHDHCDLCHASTHVGACLQPSPPHHVRLSDLSLARIGISTHTHNHGCRRATCSQTDTYSIITANSNVQEAHTSRKYRDNQWGRGLNRRPLFMFLQRPPKTTTGCTRCPRDRNKSTWHAWYSLSLYQARLPRKSIFPMRSIKEFARLCSAVRVAPCTFHIFWDFSYMILILCLSFMTSSCSSYARTFPQILVPPDDGTVGYNFFLSFVWQYWSWDSLLTALVSRGYWGL